MRWMIAALLAVLIGGGAARAEGFERTCVYYNNVAYNDRHTLAYETFRMRLANDCDDALQVLGEARPGTAEYLRAEAYLGRLQHFRATLIDMAREGFRRAEADTSRRRYQQIVGNPVSRTGEILIARVMGLTEAQGAWRDWRQTAQR